MARLEGAYEQVSQRLMNIDPRFDGVDRKVDMRFDALDKKIDQRVEGLDKKIDQRFGVLDKKIDGFEITLNTKIDQRFMWTIGVVVSTWLTTLASIYLHH